MNDSILLGYAEAKSGVRAANSVRTLAVWCLGRNCGHSAVLDVTAYASDVPVPSFGPCGVSLLLACQSSQKRFHGGSFFGGWRDQLQVRFGHDFRLRRSLKDG